MSDPQVPIAFIGLGVMGASMAGHLLRAGHPLRVHTRTRAKAQPLLEAGARWCESPAAAAREAEVIMTMVGFPPEVEEVYFGAGGVLDAAQPGSLLIDFTTSKPSLAVRIHAEARRRELLALDAPVSGGDVGAREARLSIMVGGDAEAFQRAREILALLGKSVVHQGPAGRGQHAKLTNQIVIAGSMLSIAEAMAYARRSGLDAETVLASVASGAATSWALMNLAPRMLAGNWAPGFYVKHFIKDLRIALEEGDALGLDLAAVRLALARYEELAARGGADQGTQAIYRVVDREGSG